EDEEGRLERILGIVVVADDAAADAEHHRRVPADEHGKGVLVPVRDEALQELPVAHPGAAVGQRRPLDPVDHPAHRIDRHVVAPLSDPPSPLYIGRSGRAASIYFGSLCGGQTAEALCTSASSTYPPARRPT